MISSCTFLIQPHRMSITLDNPLRMWKNVVKDVNSFLITLARKIVVLQMSTSRLFSSMHRLNNPKCCPLLTFVVIKD